MGPCCAPRAYPCHMAEIREERLADRCLGILRIESEAVGLVTQVLHGRDRARREFRRDAKVLGAAGDDVSAIRSHGLVASLSAEQIRLSEYYPDPLVPDIVISGDGLDGASEAVCDPACRGSYGQDRQAAVFLVAEREDFSRGLVALRIGRFHALLAA